MNCECGKALGTQAQFGMLGQPDLCPACTTMKYCRHMLGMLPMPDEREWSQLSEWEQGFVSSVRDQLEIKHTLSEAQVASLEKIYKERQ